MVGAGAKLSDIDKETVRHSLATPLGSYSQLGVAGYTLLGGTGFLSRSFGCTADNCLEFGKSRFWKPQKFNMRCLLCMFVTQISFWLEIFSSF